MVSLPPLPNSDADEQPVAEQISWIRAALSGLSPHENRNVGMVAIAQATIGFELLAKAFFLERLREDELLPTQSVLVVISQWMAMDAEISPSESELYARTLQAIDLTGLPEPVAHNAFVMLVGLLLDCEDFGNAEHYSRRIQHTPEGRLLLSEALFRLKRIHEVVAFNFKSLAWHESAVAEWTSKNTPPGMEEIPE